MYHYVRDIRFSRYPGIKGLEISNFIKQIQYLNGEYNIVSMARILEFYTQARPLPPNALLLTFDDGYAEHFSNVYPVLKYFGLTGAFYIPAKTIQEHKVLDVRREADRKLPIGE